jgi:hypothetical protein
VIGCFLGATQVTLSVFFAVVFLRVVTISFSPVVSVPEFGKLVCKDVILRSFPLIGML